MFEGRTLDQKKKTRRRHDRGGGKSLDAKPETVQSLIHEKFQEQRGRGRGAAFGQKIMQCSS